MLEIGSPWVKNRSQGQIKEIPCGCSRGHMSCSVDLKIGQNVCLDKISDDLKLGHLRSKIRSLGQLQEFSCGCFGGHISCSTDLKIGQNVCLETHMSLGLGHLGS